MLLKSLMKNPFLGVGFLFFAIFIFQLRDNGIFAKRAQKMIPTSCRSVVSRLEKYMHPSWDINCSGNNLVIEAEVDKKIVKENYKNPKDLKAKMYKALANMYLSVSRYSPPESLERTMIVSIRLKHPHMTISSISEGKHVYNMKSLKNKNNLARHFRQTVQVQEATK